MKHFEHHSVPMTPLSRMDIAMHKGIPDRVPVMCQLSLGHYLLNTGIAPARLWHCTEAFVEALVTLRNRYRFDGILINLPGHPENWQEEMLRIESKSDAEIVHWKDGSYTLCPSDDNVQCFRVHPQTGEYIRDIKLRLSVDEVDVDRLFYENPHTNGGLKYPYHFYDIARGYRDPSKPEEWFPEYEFRAIGLLRKATGGTVSIHGEFFSPFTQFMELLGYENALIALLTHPDKSRAILDRFGDGCVYYGRELARHGVDAILCSSAFAGAGFISRKMYGEFVLPYEKKCWDGIKAEFPDLPCYTHTCGAIGDRLDLMEATGLDGIDTLDPPPLGTVDLQEAKRLLGTRVFIKGNIDSVNTLLHKDLEAAKDDMKQRIAWGKPGGAYILSTACSVAPRVQPDRLEALVDICEKYGRYEAE
ncbi:uroporphyrinogen decarboxylase family protein [bacterium]|nr:uroporphyrinogen decarboxylase family protein [bacterium]